MFLHITYLLFMLCYCIYVLIMLSGLIIGMVFILLLFVLCVIFARSSEFHALCFALVAIAGEFIAAGLT